MSAEFSANSIKMAETYRRAPDEIKEVMDDLAELPVTGFPVVRQIECRCPPDYKFCECQDKLFNRRRFENAKLDPDVDAVRNEASDNHNLGVSSSGSDGGNPEA